MAPAVTVVRLTADEIILVRYALRLAANAPKQPARGQFRRLLTLAECATAIAFRAVQRPPRHAHADRWGLR
jgi:hypothetical protein